MKESGRLGTAGHFTWILHDIHPVFTYMCYIVIKQMQKRINDDNGKMT